MPFSFCFSFIFLFSAVPFAAAFDANRNRHVDWDKNTRWKRHRNAESNFRKNIRFWGVFLFFFSPWVTCVSESSRRVSITATCLIFRIPSEAEAEYLFAAHKIHATGRVTPTGCRVLMATMIDNTSAFKKKNPKKPSERTEWPLVPGTAQRWEVHALKDILICESPIKKFNKPSKTGIFKHSGVCGCGLLHVSFPRLRCVCLTVGREPSGVLASNRPHLCRIKTLPF